MKSSTKAHPEGTHHRMFKQVKIPVQKPNQKLGVIREGRVFDQRGYTLL